MPNALIAMSGRLPQLRAPESDANSLAQVMRIGNMADQQRLNRLQIQAAERGAQENALANRLFSESVGPDGQIDRNKLTSGFASQGLGSRLPALQKQFADQDKAGADHRKALLDEAKTRTELAGQAFGSVRQNPTIENVHATLDHLAQSGVFTPQAVAHWKGLVNPQNASAFADQMFRMALGAKDQLAKYETRNLGGTTDTIAIDPVDGTARTVNSVQNTQSPDNKASVSASMANAAATRDVAAATRDAAKLGKTYDSEQGLRKEFEALPEVKNYKQALPSFKGIEDAVSRNTPMSDINIVYGIAKLYDPTSVVREGEYATVANSPAIPERIKGYAQYLAGGGKLTEEVKKQILTEAKSRIKSYEDQYTAARTDYESIAKRSGVDPTRVFPSPVKPAATKPSAVAPAAGGASGEWKIEKVGG